MHRKWIKKTRLKANLAYEIIFCTFIHDFYIKSDAVIFLFF